MTAISSGTQPELFKIEQSEMDSDASSDDFDDFGQLPTDFDVQIDEIDEIEFDEGLFYNPEFFLGVEPEEDLEVEEVVEVDEHEEKYSIINDEKNYEPARSRKSRNCRNLSDKSDKNKYA